MLNRNFWRSLAPAQFGVVGTALLLALSLLGGIAAHADARPSRDQIISSVLQANSVDELAEVTNRYMNLGDLDPAVLDLMEQTRQRLLDAGQSAPASGSSPVAMSARNMEFLKVSIGTTSPAKTLTLTNNGLAAIQFQSGYPMTYAPFAIASNSCGSTLAAGASCALTITFTPTGNGRSTGTLYWAFAGYAGTSYTSLAGTGGAPLSLYISPPSTSGQSYPTLSFGTVAIGATSAPMTATLTNTGSTALQFATGYPSISSPFAIASNNCGATLAAGASCTLSFTFSPTTGMCSGCGYGGYAYLYFNTYSEYRYVYMLGTVAGSSSGGGGTVNTPSITVLPSSYPALSFGLVNVGQTSSALAMSITNNTAAAVTFTSGYPKIATYSSGTASTVFKIASTTCGATLAAGASCLLSITFSPTLIGSDTAYLYVYTPIYNSSFNLTGTGNGTPLSIQLSATSLDFDTTAPVCTLSAIPGTITSGASSILAAVCSPTATSYTWSSNTGFASSASSGSVTPTATTTYTVAGVNAVGAGASAGATITVNIPPVSVAPHMVNLSTRAQVLTGDGVMIGGFIIQGDSPQTVLIRAVGPNLANYGVTGVLADPMLELHQSSDGAIIASNDNWGDAANAAAIQATGQAPVSPFESAILITLQPGAYTTIVRGVNGGTGVGIVEVFAQ